MSEPKKWWEKLLLFVIMPIFDYFKRIVKSLIENKLILLLAGVYIIFHELFEELCTAKVVKYILSKCVSSSWNDVVFGIILLWAAILCVYRLYKRFNISDKRILISLILLFAWCYYRFIEHVWAFEPFTLWNGLKYVDAIAAFLVGNLLVLIYFNLYELAVCIRKAHACWFEKKMTDDKQYKGFCFDSPLSKSDPDLLNREDFVKSICIRIQNTAGRDASFAIGITSEWGNGKTSLLNLIERNLDKNRRVIVHYNPWLNSDKKSATLSFFDEMSAALKAYDSSLSNDILKYAKMLIDSSAGKYANLLTTCLSLDGTPTLRERFEEINKAIKRTRLQIIVFIDDIDRLYDSEILEVLSLIRNSANFSNTIFIVAYDRNYLVAALKKVNEHHPHAYLEKIFQLELPLPQFDKDVLLKILQDKLNFHFDYFASCNYCGYNDYEKDKEELNSIVFDSNLFYSAGIKTVRDVSRLVNSFLVSYDFLKGNIVLSDLLNLELLRIKYLGVYELLANKIDHFLVAQERSSTDEAIITFFKYPNSQIYFFEYLKKHIDEACVSEERICDIEKCAGYLFSEKKYESCKSIRSPIGVKRYFYYSLLNGNLSQTEFDNLRNEESSFWDYIKKYANGSFENVLELKEMLEGVIYKDNNEYKKIICVYLYLASQCDEKYYSFFMNGLWEIFTNRKAQDRNTDEMNGTIQEYILIKISTSFIDYILRLCFTHDFFGENKHAKFFFKLCAENWFDIFVVNIILINKPYQTDDTMDDWPFNQIGLPDETILCTETIERDFNLYNIKPVISEAFQDWTKFESFINELDETRSKGLNEFKDFYQKLKEADFKEIKYDFKEIKLKD